MRVILTLLCGILGCKSSEPWNGPVIDWKQDTSQIERQLAEIAPSGRSIHEVKEILEHNGFSCRFGEENGKRYLRCEHDEPMGLLVAWRTLVVLEFEDDRVTERSFTQAGIGP
jgi:hypothetical protein